METHIKNIMTPILFYVMCFTKLISCNDYNQFENPDYLYSNPNVKLCIKYINNRHDSIDFLLTIDSIGLKNFKGIATLVLVEDVDGKMIVPEGTDRIDYNNLDDVIGIKCDSTYCFIGEHSSISFAIESKSKQRMDFHLLKYNKLGTKTELSLDETLLLHKHK